MSSNIGDGISLFDFGDFHHNPVELNDMVERHGTGCELRRGVQCPCVRIDTGQARARCRVCRGMGWTHPEDRREPMIVLVMSRQPENKERPAGWFNDGTVVALFPNSYIPSKGDMILPECDPIVVHQVLRRNRLQVDSQRVAQRTQVYDERVPAMRGRDDRLLYDEGVTMEDVYWINHAGTDREELVRAFMGRDWRLAPGGEIEWVSEHAPPEGSAFSVRYQAPAAYWVYASTPMLRSEGGVPYPWKATLGRIDKMAEQDLR